MSNRRHGPESALERATRAMRDLPVPDGPDNEFQQRLVDRLTASDGASPSQHYSQQRQQILAAFDEAQAHGSARSSNRLFHSLHKLNWRAIMYHPATRITAAATFLVALGTIFWIFAGGGSRVALADFVEPLLNAETAQFKLTTTTNGKQVSVADVMVSGSRTRIEVRSTDETQPRRQINITDAKRPESLTLLPVQKLAIVTRLVNRPPDQKSGGFLSEIRELLQTQYDKVKRESLGKREIDGRTMVGYRVVGPAMTLEIWGDPQTRLPHRFVQRIHGDARLPEPRAAQTSLPQRMNAEVIASDFQFNIDLDESLFSLEPPEPEGYTVQTQEIDVSKPSEKDLIEALRQFAELADGMFPDALNMEVGSAVIKEKLPKDDDDESTKEKRLQTVAKLTATLSRGFTFPLLAGPKADAHYAGKGVRRGTEDRPIFWYRPEGAKSYRVIYADLSVKESSNAPDVAGAVPIAAPEGRIPPAMR